MISIVDDCCERTARSPFSPLGRRGDGDSAHLSAIHEGGVE